MSQIAQRVREAGADLAGAAYDWQIAHDPETCPDCKRSRAGTGTCERERLVARLLVLFPYPAAPGSPDEEATHE